MHRPRISSISRFSLMAVGLLALLAAALTAVITAGDSGRDGAEVRIQARNTDNGSTEVALQVRNVDHTWGEQILPRERFLAADSEPGRWRSSSTIHLETEEAIDPDVVGATATAEMRGPDGDSMGTVTIIQGPRGLLIQARLTGVPEGWHGFHIHETGSCDPDFSAAGGHYDPTGIGHGVLHEGGHHPGDTVNIYAHSDGVANADQYTVDATLGAGTTTLFDADGSAIIVHEGPDSYGADPAAGARIACGVITLD